MVGELVSSPYHTSRSSTALASSLNTAVYEGQGQFSHCNDPRPALLPGGEAKLVMISRINENQVSMYLLSHKLLGVFFVFLFLRQGLIISFLLVWNSLRRLG